MVLPITFARVGTMLMSIVLPYYYLKEHSLMAPMEVCLLICVICTLLCGVVMIIDAYLEKEIE